MGTLGTFGYTTLHRLYARIFLVQNFNLRLIYFQTRKKQIFIYIYTLKTVYPSVPILEC